MQDQGELERAIKAMRQQKGKHDALDPLVEAIGEWHEAGLTTLIGARTVDASRSPGDAAAASRCGRDPHG